jgi:putative ABC transport system permease protein
MRLLSRLRLRLRAIVRPARADRDLRDELQAHLDRQVETLIAGGMAPHAAAVEARRTFGGLAQAEEACRDARGVRVFSELVQDLRYAGRMLRRTPGLTAVVVMTLGVAIGANTALFSLFDAVLLKALLMPQPDRVLVIGETAPATHGTAVSYPDFLDWRARQTTFQDLAASMVVGGVITGGSEPDRVFGRAVSREFFAILGARFELGRPFTDLEDRPNGERAIILSHALWQRRYGADRGVIGRIALYNGEPHTIVGVLPADFDFYGTANDNNGFFIALGLMADQHYMHDRTSHPGLAVIGRMRTGVTIRQASADLAAIAADLAAAYPATNLDETVTVHRLLDDYVGDARLTLWMLLGSAMLVLTIACANIANLLLARSGARVREVALRLALGAGRRRILRQLLTESLLLAGIGGAAGALVGWLATSSLARVARGALPRMGDLAPDWRILAFALGATTLAGVVFGCVPAWQTARVDVQPALRRGTRGATGDGHRLRDAFVVAEIALSLALVAGAGLLLRSYARLVRVDPGYDAHHVLTLRLRFPDAAYRDPGKVATTLRQMLTRIAALPGVDGAALTTGVPMGRTFPDRFAIAGRPDTDPRRAPAVLLLWITPDYFRTLGIRLIAGRVFTAADDERAALVAVVDEEFVRQHFPGRPPATVIGERVKFFDNDPRWRDIVGVVAHVRPGPLEEAGGAGAYGPYEQLEPGWRAEIGRAMDVAVRSTVGPEALVAAIKQQLHAVDPDVPVSHVRTLDQAVSLAFAPRRFNLWLICGFGAVALLLCLVGVYGVMSYAVNERTREIGVRLALGAAPRQVRAMVLGRAVRLAALGAAIGTVGAFIVSRAMSGLLYAINPGDPATLASVVAVVVFVSLVASYLPARRAMRMDPVIALRDE